MISFDEAVRLVAGSPSRLHRKLFPRDCRAGRVLAEPVIARIASPRTDVSAMDGYAVREADLAAFPARLKLVGRVVRRCWLGWRDRRRGMRSYLHWRACSQRRRPGRHPGACPPRQAIWPSSTSIRVALDIFAGAAAISSRGDELLQAGQLLHPRAVVAAAAADVAELELFTSRGFRSSAPETNSSRPVGSRRRDAVPGERFIRHRRACPTLGGAKIVGRTRLPDDCT
jgi:molybdopterin molybdotransferase